MTPTFVAVLIELSSLSAEFGSLVDRGRSTDCAALFTDDAKMIFGPGSPKPGTLDGIEAIRAFLTARQALTSATTRHVATNFRLVWEGGPTASLASLLTVFRSDDETRQPLVSVVADVEERFVRSEDGSWHIQERLTTPIFTRTAS